MRTIRAVHPMNLYGHSMKFGRHPDRFGGHLNMKFAGHPMKSGGHLMKFGRHPMKSGGHSLKCESH